MLLFVGVLFLGLTEANIKPQRRKDDNRPLCPCKDRTLHARVVGGHQAGLGAYPYAVDLQFSPYNGSADRNPYCGGTLISDSHVLTAAHCARGSPKDILIDVGVYSAQQRSDSSPSKVKTIKRFPKHVPGVFHYDIAILELDTPVTWEHGLRPAVLPPPGLELVMGVTVTVYGWGRMSYDSGEKPKTLQSVSLPVVDNELCQESFKTTIMSNMLCAGGQEGKDACIGDSGSGLVVRLDNTNVLCGVVSFGRKCALPHVPGAYTRVSSYTEWIMAETLSSGCAPCVYHGLAGNETNDNGF